MSQLFHALDQLVNWAFWYCCDFMVNLGNFTRSSYDEANTWVLLLGIPGLLALLIGVRVAQGFQLWRLRAGPGATRQAGRPQQPRGARPGGPAPTENARPRRS